MPGGGWQHYCDYGFASARRAPWVFKVQRAAMEIVSGFSFGCVLSS